jgi:hypothetical protein
MAKLTAEEMWDALDDATVDATIEQALAQSPEERRRDVAAAGFDLNEVDAKADALFASVPVRIPTAAPAPALLAAPVAAIKRRRLRPAVVVSAALALAAGVALVIVAQQESPIVTSPPPSNADSARAHRLEAKEACKQQQWERCLEELDEARKVDPDGDRAPEVQELRRRASGQR